MVDIMVSHLAENHPETATAMELRSNGDYGRWSQTVKARWDETDVEAN
jgi:hypothetical protein